MDSSLWVLLFIGPPYMALLLIHAIWLTYLRFRIDSFQPVQATLVRATMIRKVRGSRIGIDSLDSKIQSSEWFISLLAEYTYSVAGQRVTSRSVIPGESFAIFRSNGDPSVIARLRQAEKSASKAITAYVDPTRPERAFLTNEVASARLAGSFATLVLFAVGGSIVFFLAKEEITRTTLVLSALWLPLGTYIAWRVSRWTHEGGGRELQAL